MANSISLELRTIIERWILSFFPDDNTGYAFKTMKNVCGKITWKEKGG